MSAEPGPPVPQPDDPPGFPAPETGPAAAPGESQAGGLGLWAILALVAVLVAYPLARWMMGGGAPPAGNPSASGAPPAAAIARLNESLQHAQGGRFKECIDTATEATRFDPTLASAYNNIGFCSGNLRLWDDAIRNLQEAIRLDPAKRLAGNNLAWARQEKAKSSGQPPAVPPSAEVAALLNQSLQHAQAKRFTECMDTATQAVKLGSTSAPACNNLGFCAGNLRLWDEAVRNLEEATRLDPNLALARNNLAWARGEKARAAGTPAR